MGKHAEALTAALQQKLTLVEYFKSDNALLQNSLRYFTHTGQNVGKQVHSGANRGGRNRRASRTYCCASYTRRNSARAKRPRQRSIVCQPNPRLQPGLDTLVAHGWLIVKLLPHVDTLLRQIIAAPTTAHADALQNAVLQYANRVEARAQLFRVLLYLVAVILLGYLLYQFARLRANAAGLAPGQYRLTERDGRAPAGCRRLARQRRTLPCHHRISQ